MTRFERRVEAERLVLLLEIHGNHVCRCDPEIQLLVVSSPLTTGELVENTRRPSFELSSKISLKSQRDAGITASGMRKEIWELINAFRSCGLHKDLATDLPAVHCDSESLLL